MAGGYEWMYRFNLPLRTEFEFMNRTEVTYNVSPLFTNAPSGALASTAQNVTGMLKAYWHFPVDSALWWPFVSVASAGRTTRRKASTRRAAAAR